MQAFIQLLDHLLSLTSSWVSILFTVLKSVEGVVCALGNVREDIEKRGLIKNLIIFVKNVMYIYVLEIAL